jgi:predicted DCC family thiol-disulfide oxidoreductase YuxK
MNKDSEQSKIVFFDGICVLCNRSVDFLLKRDKKRLLKFASLQSECAKTLLAKEMEPVAGLESVVFLENGKIFTESTAVLRICTYLPFPWSLFSGMLILPRLIRDPAYRWIAKNRYRWFGKRDQCRMPDEFVRERILE